jgi:hypothetical protein
MANNMQWLQECVSLKVISLQTVSVVKTNETLQHLRIKYRWEEMKRKPSNKKQQRTRLKTHSIYF